MNKRAPARVGAEPRRGVVARAISVSEHGIAGIMWRDKRNHVWGSAHEFYGAGELIPKEIISKLPHSDKGIVS